VANVLKSFGVKKGDTVSVYLPMTWHAVAAFLACARIGAIHSVVFAGFSAESLRDRVKDCGCRVVITSDEGKRGGKTIATKAIVDAALSDVQGVEHVLVLQRTGKSVSWVQGRDKWWHEEITKVPAYCSPEVMNAEDPLFILYVSDSSFALQLFAGCLIGSPDPSFSLIADRQLHIIYRRRDRRVSRKVLCTPPVDTSSVQHFPSNMSLTSTPMINLHAWLMSVGSPVTRKLLYHDHSPVTHFGFIPSYSQTATSSMVPSRTESRQLYSNRLRFTQLHPDTGKPSTSTNSPTFTARLPLFVSFAV